MGLSRSCDVVVAGAGPAGAVAAALLAERGFDVSLLERSPRPAEKICGEYVGPRAVQDLDRLGFAEALRPLPARVLRGMVMVAPDGREIAADFVDAGGTARSGRAIARAELDGALARDAARRGASVSYGQSLTSAGIDGERVVVRTREESEWRARLLIGADGRFSAVAHAFGLSEAPRERDASAQRGVIHAWLRGVSGLDDLTGRGEMHLLADGGYLGLDPLADGRCNAGLVVAAATVADAVRAQDGAARLLAAAAASPALAGRFARARVEGNLRYLAPLRTQVRAVVAARTLLAGDAAGFFDPLTGEGIQLAVASAELAADAAARALESGATAEATRLALASYARAHSRLVRGKRLFHPLLQALLRRPALANRIGRGLQSHPAAAQRLLAVIGSLREPSALLHPECWSALAPALIPALRWLPRRSPRPPLRPTHAQ